MSRNSVAGIVPSSIAINYSQKATVISYGCQIPAATWDNDLVDRADLVRLRQVRDLIDRDYAKPLDVPALARVALMSPGHFSRSFRAAFGETPYSYLMTRRVERAKALLR